MGSSSSKFRKHLQNGDEYAALQLFNSSFDLRKDLDPNSSYGDTYSHDTPMHYAARHAMKSLLRIFLYEQGGNPNKKNARNETSLHCLCMAVNATSVAAQQRRVECLSLILQWRGAVLKDGEVEKVDLGAQDEKDNTGLHYAAASGLKRCVEYLVTKGAPLFKENAQKQTPCDCAEKNGHNNIALYLESKMVFSNEDENEEETEILGQMNSDELYSGLRAQDLQEAKDQLLVETADMLRVPLFTAEALLRNHEWSREMLLEAWMDDPVACCEKCGVMPPSVLYADRTEPPDHDLTSPIHSSPPEHDTICDICACLIPTSEEPVPISCDHQFCRGCWQRYLTGKITEGDAHNITCPGYQCIKLVPVEVIETLVSRDMARRYLQFDIKAFVESNPHIKWCPYPGCGRAVKLPDSDNPLSPTFRDPNQLNAANDFSHAVDCGNGHIFCWECLGEAHEPASCEHWRLWHQKMGDIKPEELSGTEEETEMAANCLWLITNSKTCPNCKSPIQKNEGCNHMKCSKCKHDFCWVCLESWKKHSSATGGYFRCNRYEAVRSVESQTDVVKTEAEARNKRMQELNKFVHYYTRFKNHENSFKLEEPLLNTAKEKMMVLAKAVTDNDSALEETRFVEDAVRQLLKARRVLKCCYVYGYYLEDTGYKKPIFEFMQTELEECTETLSEMIARPYLRTPRHKIIQTAHLVQRKRHEFVTAIAKGLVPADTSPTQRRKRNKYSVELDDDLKKALLASVQDDMTPQTAWVKDPTGRHTNLSAVLDWPEESDESDGEEGKPLAPAAVCIRKGCTRARAQNPRTGEIHDHCSIRCFRMDQLEQREGAVTISPSEYFDYQIELLRALEMSRLEFQREMGSLQPGTGDRSPRSPCLSDQRPDHHHHHPHHHHLPPQQDPQAPQTTTPGPPLILQAPPKGRIPRGWGWAVPGISGEGGGEAPETDTDLLRALQLSASTYRDEERDLRLAIELSLRENQPDLGPPTTTGTPPTTTSSPPPPPPPPPPETHHQHQQQQQQQQIQCTTQPFSQSNLHHHLTSVFAAPPGLGSRGAAMGMGVDDISNPPPPPPTSYHHYHSEILGACSGGGDKVTCTGEGCGLKTSKSHEWDSNGSPSLPRGEPEATNPIRVSRSHEWEHHHMTHPHHQHKTPPANLDLNMDQSKLVNSFGLIKDISVNNILTSDTDKTKDFDMKDFSQLYNKKYPAAMQDMEAAVFEPRPPYPSGEGGRYLHLTPPPAMTWNQTGGAKQDVWVEQSKQDHYAPAAYTRSPSSRSPRQSIAAPPRSPRENRPWSPRDGSSPRLPRDYLSRSPRDSGYITRSPRGESRDPPPRSPWEPARSPRDCTSRSPREAYSRSPRGDLPRPQQPVFTFEPYATAGSVPDLLTSCPARCLAATATPNRNPTVPPQPHNDVILPYDDDDPGPRLDAVLRSLQKLSSRLGDNDEFLSSLSTSNPPDSDPPPPTTASSNDLNSTTSQHGVTQHHGNLNITDQQQQQQRVHSSPYNAPSNHSEGQAGSATRGQGGAHPGAPSDEPVASYRHLRAHEGRAPEAPPPEEGSDGEPDENAVFV